MEDRSLFHLKVFLRELRRQLRDLDPGRRKAMPAYVEVLSGVGVAGRGSETDLSDLSRSKPFQTKRIWLPQRKKERKMRHFGELESALEKHRTFILLIG